MKYLGNIFGSITSLFALSLYNSLSFKFFVFFSFLFLLKLVGLFESTIIERLLLFADKLFKLKFIILPFRDITSVFSFLIILLLFELKL